MSTVQFLYKRASIASTFSVRVSAKYLASTFNSFDVNRSHLLSTHVRNVLFPSQAPQLGMEFLSFLRAAVTKHAFGAVQTKAYIHGARLLRTRLAARQSEDCLYLNVRTTSPLVIGAQRKEVLEPGVELGGDNPTQEEGEVFRTTDDDISKPAKADKLPVIVYIHGGDYHDGAGGSRPFYAANALPVKGKVVLVTFNYRLGLMGHFTHPELSKEAEAERRPAVCGNYSILDQASIKVIYLTTELMM